MSTGRETRKVYEGDDKELESKEQRRTKRGRKNRKTDKEQDERIELERRNK